MEHVIIQLGDWQREHIIILGTLVFFVLGWSVFGWSR